MQSKIQGGDGVIVAQGTGIKMLRSFHFHAHGATVGDMVYLRDGGPTGTIKGFLVVGVTNGNDGIVFSGEGIPFGDGIYYSEMAVAPNTIWATVTWE